MSHHIEPASAKTEVAGSFCLNSFLLLASLLICVGCAGAPATTTTSCPVSGFIVRGAISQDFLQQAWAEAQKKVATGGIALNAVAVQFSGAEPKLSPADARALDVKPCGLMVIAEPEVPATELNAIVPRKKDYSDPTGIIRCNGSPTGYCFGQTINYNTIHLPASNPLAAEWESMAVILDSLGFDASGM